MKNAITEIDFAIKLYSSNLSEKLSLVANTNSFFQYINAGPETRKKLYYEFITELSGLQTSEITGMSIYSQQGDLIFKNGNESSDYIDIQLCYLNSFLNSKLGDCLHTWKIYFDKKYIAKKMMYLNPHLTPCSNALCITQELASNRKFGSFMLSNSSDTHLNFSVKESGNHLNDIFSIFLISIVFLGAIIYFLISKAIDHSIREPISYIVKSLKENKELTSTIHIEELDYLSKQISKSLEYIKAIDRAKLASQIAHDIRSPLASLEIATNSNNISEKEREMIINNSIVQIRNIANQLLDKNSTSPIRNTSLIYPIIDYCIIEKRTELLNASDQLSLEIEIHKDIYLAIVNSIPSILKVILSNILNNAIEASRKNIYSFVKLKAFCESKHIIIQIEDNGRGIEKSILPFIFNEGFSNKKYGTGLGLYHAKKYLVSWGGDISADSCNGITSIKLMLPKCKEPKWFLTSLKVPKKATTIIIDDSLSIRDLWHHKFEKLNINTIFLQSPEEFYTWWNTNNTQITEKLIFLVDYEFRNSKENGLHVMRYIGSGYKKVLVTSHYEDINIIEELKNLQVKILPKYYIDHLDLT